MSQRQQVFVAYPSRDPAIAEMVFAAVRKANALPLPIIYQPWEFNDVSGQQLASPILEKIDDAPFIIADVTYLNPNVVYEVGYAIGRGKRAFLIRHASTVGDKDVAKTAGIFDTIGYHEYVDAETLKDRLAADISLTSLSFTKTINSKSPIYIIEPLNRDGNIGTLVSRLKKAGYGRYRSFTPDEDTRLSTADAIRQVSTSSGVVVPMQSPGVDGSISHNIRCMFVAGLADGMQTPKLILAPAGFDAPLDVRDDVQFYHGSAEIADAVARFCPLMVEYSAQVEPSGIDRRSLLQSLSIGDPRAENEMATLERYYLSTHQYERALRGEVNLVVGRKGSGKTALFISVRDRIRADKRNIAIDLKPEGYQLIKIKEDILTYLSEGARQHLITAFWEYLILLEVAYKILEKDKTTHRFNHDIHDLYIKLSNTYYRENAATEGDFSERLSTLSTNLAAKYRERYGQDDTKRLTTNEVTELLYTHDIRQLRKLLAEYLEKKNAVWVLFDNLDKGWSTQGIDVIDAIVLRCLVDAGRRIERDMKKDGLIFHCIVFVRNDAYDHLMRSSPDYGKEMRATLDWRDPDLLKEMLRLRLVSSMPPKDRQLPFETIWRELCISHFAGEDSSSYLINRSLMRPRNLLKIFNHCRGAAANFQRDKIDEMDIEKGLKAYSDDLLEELDRELTDVFPDADSLIYYFLDQKRVLSVSELEAILKAGSIPEDDYPKAKDFFLYYGVLGLRIGEDDHFIYTVNYDSKILKIRSERAGQDLLYVVNPAFWPAFGFVHEN